MKLWVKTSASYGSAERLTNSGRFDDLRAAPQSLSSCSLEGNRGRKRIGQACFRPRFFLCPDGALERIQKTDHSPRPGKCQISPGRDLGNLRQIDRAAENAERRHARRTQIDERV
jgi:hypothetical protein